MRKPLTASPTAVPAGLAGRSAFVAILLTALGLSGWYLTLQHTPNAVPFGIGIALGTTLYLSDFGFASAYRRLIVLGDTSGVASQLLMVALATLLFAAVLPQGSFLGRQIAGAVAPVSWTVGVGALVFGIGMQLASGCASGTLYTLGGGRQRALLVLAAFCAGGFWASLHMGRWPSIFLGEPIVLAERIGWTLAAAIQISTLLLAALLLRWPRRSAPAADLDAPRFRVLGIPWRLLGGGLVLAVLNFATLLVAGHPWSITWGFTLWGAKAAEALGWNSASNPFWNTPEMHEVLRASVLDDLTSVMNFGIVAGAAAASLALRRSSANTSLPLRSAAAALIGGILMGYGARVAYGCNIGAFFSGAASTSLHGWLWLICALPGNWIGVALRPLFGLRNT
jgi:hypothetical protein